MNSFVKLLTISAAATFLTAGFALSAEPIGKVSALLGTPTASGPGGQRAISSGSPLYVGDTIRASNGGNVQITLNDGTRLVVGPASQLVLQTYLQRNKATASKVAVKALRGTFRFITGKSPKSAYAIQTSNATIGIRGTGFDFRVRDITIAAVMVGAIRLRGSNGKSVNAASGCGVAEAGGGSTSARLLTGAAKANRLRQDFPFINNQGSLASPFRLPVQNCPSTAIRVLGGDKTEDTGDDGGKPESPDRGN
jgi:hypothetical protein